MTFADDVTSADMMFRHCCYGNKDLIMKEMSVFSIHLDFMIIPLNAHFFFLVGRMFVTIL